MSKVNVWMRSKEKWVLAILCGVLMVTFGAGSSIIALFSPSSVKGGEIFGKTISGKTVLNLAVGLSADRSRQRLQNDDLIAMAWETLIYEEEAKRHGIRAGDVDVMQELALRFPTKDGDFNPAAYQAFLKRGRVNQSLYEDALLKIAMGRKLSKLVLDSVVLPPEEAWLWFSREQQKVGAKYLRLTADSLQSLVALDDASVEAFYKEHRDKPRGTGPFGAGYQEPERIKIEYIMARYDDFAKAAEISQEQVKAYYDEHKEKYIVAPEPKAEAAEMPVEEPAPAVEEKNDESSAPEEDSAALEEISVPEEATPPETPEKEGPSYKPLEDVAEDIEKILRDEAGKKAVKNTMTTVSNAIYEAFAEAVEGEEESSIDLAAIAERFNLDYRQTQLFSKDEVETLFPGADRFSAMAFGKGPDGVGTTSVRVEAREGIFIFRTLELQQAKPAAYDDTVKADAAQHLRLKKASELALEIVGSATSADTLDVAADIVTAAIDRLIEEAGVSADPKEAPAYFTVGETKLFGRPSQTGMYAPSARDYGTGLPGDFDCRMFAETAFDLKGNEIGTAFDSEDDTRVVYLLQRVQTVFPDRAEFDSQKKFMIPQLRLQKQRAVITAWQEDLRRRAQPSDDVKKYLGRLDGWGG